MSAWATLKEFHTDQGTLGYGPGRPRQQVLRLHRSQRGNVTLLYLLFLIFLYVVLAMVWNTGRASTAQIHAQTAADTAAYTAAVFTSRAVNLVAASNLQILKNIDGSIILMTLGLTLATAWIIWSIYFTICAVRMFAGDFSCLPPLILEALVLALWTVYAATGFPGNPMMFANNVKDLYRLQRYLVQETPRLVNEQLRLYEEEYGCDLRLTTPGQNGAVRPPLKQGNALTIAFPLMLRLLLEDNNWPDYKPFQEIPGMDLLQEDMEKQKEDLEKEKAQNDKEIEDLENKSPRTPQEDEDLDKLKKRNSQVESEISSLDSATKTLGATAFDLTPKTTLKGLTYWGYLALSTGVNLALQGGQHYDLATQWGPLEFGPTDHKSRTPFSIVALASVHASSQLMAPGVFSSPLAPKDRVLAYAQAETNLGIDQLFTRAVPIPLPFPYRVWSTWGWHWEPRLTRGEHLEDAMRADTVIRRWLEDQGGERTRVRRFQTRH